MFSWDHFTNLKKLFFFLNFYKYMKIYGNINKIKLFFAHISLNFEENDVFLRLFWKNRCLPISTKVFVCEEELCFRPLWKNCFLPSLKKLSFIVFALEKKFLPISANMSIFCRNEVYEEHSKKSFFTHISGHFHSFRKRRSFFEISLKKLVFVHMSTFRVKQDFILMKSFLSISRKISTLWGKGGFFKSFINISRKRTLLWDHVTNFFFAHIS